MLESSNAYIMGTVEALRHPPPLATSFESIMFYNSLKFHTNKIRPPK